MQTLRALSVDGPAIKLKEFGKLTDLLVAGENLARTGSSPVRVWRRGMAGRENHVAVLVDLPSALERFGMVHKGEEKVAIHALGLQGLLNS